MGLGPWWLFCCSARLGTEGTGLEESCGLTPAGNSAPCSHSLTFLCRGMERIARVKWESSWVKEQFNKESKKRAKHRQCRKRNSFKASHGQGGVQAPPGKQSSIRSNGDLGRQTPPQMSSHLPSQLYMLSVMPYAMEYLGSFGISYPACVPSQLLVSPLPTCWWREKQKMPWPCVSTA